MAGATPGDLTALEIQRAGRLIFARAGGAPGTALADAPWERFAGLLPRGVSDLDAAADWKVIVEQWLESPQPQRCFVAPNLLLDIRPEGALILQVTPSGAGRSRIRRFDFAARTANDRVAARSAWPRRASSWLRQQIELAESTQAGLAGSAGEPAEGGPVAEPLARFRAAIVAVLQALPSRAG